MSLRRVGRLRERLSQTEVRLDNFQSYINYLFGYPDSIGCFSFLCSLIDFPKCSDPRSSIHFVISICFVKRWNQNPVVGIIFKRWKRKIKTIPRGKKNLIMEEAQAGFIKFLNVLIKGKIRYYFKFTCKNIFKNIKAENCGFSRTILRINQRLGFRKEYSLIFWVENIC